MSNAPPIMNAPNPTTKRALESTKRFHWRITQNNVPGTVPPITPAIPWRPIPTDDAATPVRRSLRLGKTAQRIQATKLPKKIPKVRFIPIAGRLRNHNIISQLAMNFLTDEVWNNSPQHFTPKNLRPKGKSNRGQFRTLGNAYGTSNDGRDDIKLQEIDERPRDNGNMANRFWKRLRRHGTRGQ